MLNENSPTPQPPAPFAPVDPFFNLVKQVLRLPVRADWSSLVLVVVILAVTGSSMVGAGALLAAMALRDLVRLATMKALNAFDARLLMLPFASGELPTGISPVREAIVVLIGPAFLVGLSLVTFFISQATGPGIVQELSRTSVGLALFTLLPLKPYDGWRLLNLALFSRSARVEMVVGVVTSLLLAGLSLWMQAWFLTLFAFLNLVSSQRVLKVGRAADAFKRTGLASPLRTHELSEPGLRALYDESAKELGEPALAQKQEPQARLLAGFMKEVHLRAARVTPSVGVTLVLLTVYGALLVYFVIGLALLVNFGAPAAAS